MLKALIADRQKYSMSRRVKLELRRGRFIFDNEITSSDGIKEKIDSLYTAAMFTSKSTAKIMCHSAITFHMWENLSVTFKMCVKRFQKYRFDVSHENLKKTPQDNWPQLAIWTQTIAMKDFGRVD